MRKILSIILTPLILILLVSSTNSLSIKDAFAQTANHIVISEIQIGGKQADNEFIELYNPTDTDITIDGWRLGRKTATSNTVNNLVASLNGTIPAHGYFLIAPTEYNGTVPPDASYSTGTRIAANNTIILFSDAGVNIVDKVGLGEGETGAQDSENTPVPNPIANGSIERKACSSSTSLTMQNGDNQNGNAWDTDNNLNDFVQKELSDPQNSQSIVETSGCANTPTDILTETPTPTDETTPTSTPTSTPTDELTPTATQTPTVTTAPSEEPTPTITTKPTKTPTPTPTTTPLKIKLLGFFPLSKTICYADFSKNFFVFPKIKCITL